MSNTAFLFMLLGVIATAKQAIDLIERIDSPRQD